MVHGKADHDETMKPLEQNELWRISIEVLFTKNRVIHVADPSLKTLSKRYCIIRVGEVSLISKPELFTPIELAVKWMFNSGISAHFHDLWPISVLYITISHCGFVNDGNPWNPPKFGHQTWPSSVLKLSDRSTTLVALERHSPMEFWTMGHIDEHEEKHHSTAGSSWSMLVHVSSFFWSLFHFTSLYSESMQLGLFWTTITLKAWIQIGPQCLEDKHECAHTHWHSNSWSLHISATVIWWLKQQFLTKLNIYLTHVWPVLDLLSSMMLWWCDVLG